MTEIVRVLPFGACLVHIPLTRLARMKAKVDYARVSDARVPPVAFTFGEAFQIIDILRGERDVPPEIRPLVHIRPEFRALPSAKTFENVDVVLMEPATPIEVGFRSWVLNRTAIGLHVMGPIRAVSDHAAKRTAAWFNQGLIERNEKLQMEAAEELISLMPSDMPNPELAKAVLREARVYQRDIRESFRKLLGLVHGRPVGVVAYIFRYLPDGRVISMPHGFHEHVLEVAKEFGLPLFDPSPFVLEHGVKTCMRDDMAHYNDEYMPRVGDLLAEFVLSIHENARSLSVA